MLMKNDMEQYFSYNLWLNDHKEELKLRIFLDDMDYYLTEDYLTDKFPRIRQESDEKFALFIKYMKQGFNRKRNHLELEGYSLSSINNTSHKYEWSNRANEWENVIINRLIDSFHIIKTDDSSKSWTKQDNETNLQYFLFLCFIILNGITGNLREYYDLMQDYIIISFNSIKEFATQNQWNHRCSDYYEYIGR